jgi:hypothetical protein
VAVVRRKNKSQEVSIVAFKRIDTELTASECGWTINQMRETSEHGLS